MLGKDKKNLMQSKKDAQKKMKIEKRQKINKGRR
jgi:hypothetical protein